MPAGDRRLHLLSNQPHTKLHSQYDHAAFSLSNKIAGREPVLLNPADAAERGISEGDVVRVSNARGACLAGARLDEGVMRGVAVIATGAWFDPDGVPGESRLDKHGNPNVLTRDAGTSRLTQGCSAHTTLVEVARHEGPLPPVTAHEPPHFEVLPGNA